MIGNSGKQNVISTGNETFDRFLGGGFLNSSVNIFERQGPSSRVLDSIWNKSFAASTLSLRKDSLIYVNFNTAVEVEKQSFLASLPTPRKVKADILYKDIRSKSAQIKIAWRYTSRPISSPSDTIARVDQIDFGLSLAKETENENLEPRISIINVKPEETINEVISNIKQTIWTLKQSQPNICIIAKDILHPFSPIGDDVQKFLNLLYGFRCLSRTFDKGAILISYDCDLLVDHDNLKQQIYNLADCVVSFYSYETGENRLTGYKDIDGTLEYVKVPKINAYGFHFQRDLSDWGYRLTRNHRFFVVDELSLPPCEDDDDDKTKGAQTATKMTNIENTRRPLELVGPLEEFREVAKDVLAKKL